MSQVSIFAKGSVLDFYGQPSNPANPPANQARMFYNSTTDQMVVIDSTGADILAVGPYSIALAANAVITWGGDTGLSRDSAGVLDVGTGAQGSAAGSLKATNITITGAMAMSSGQVISWNGDTAISRDSGGVFDFGTGAQGSKAGTINATTANITGTSTLATINATKAVSSGINAMGNQTGAINVDLSLGNVISMTLTGNVTITLTNAVSSAGQEVTFIITQDGTGGRIITWPTTVPAGVAPFANQAIAAVSVFKAVVDGSGLLNFTANGAIKVYDVTTTGVSGTGSGTSHNQDFVPTATGRYRITLTVWEAVLDASGATITVRPFCSNGGIAMLQTATNPGLGLTSLAGSQGMVCSAFATTTFSSFKLGWTSTITGTTSTGSWAVNFTVEYLGN